MITPPRKKNIDKEDLLALEASLSDEPFDPLPGLPSSPVKQSPVKAHNKEFEMDFDSDLSDDLTDVERLPKRSQSKISQIVHVFQASSSPTGSNGVLISQLKTLARSAENQPLRQQPQKKQERLDDLDDIFASDFDGSQPQKLDSEHSKESHIQISAPESSSPTYHRIETLYPQIPDTRLAPISNLAHKKPPHNTCVRENNPFLFKSTNSDPLAASTQDNRKSPRKLYPTFDDYEKKYGTSSRPGPVQPSESIFMTPALADVTKDDSGAIGDGKPTTTRTLSRMIPQPEKSKAETTTASSSNPVPQRRNKRPQSLQGLLKRPKQDTPQLMLMTQRTIDHNIAHSRGMATDASSKINGKSNAQITVPKVVQPIILSHEQQQIVNLALQGNSLFYTGSAGTGKSILLKSLIKQLRGSHDYGTVAVTASTGMAACAIGGITLHSFAGIGLGKGDAHFLVNKVKKSRKASKRWRTIEVLVIDEISMISGELFEKLDHIACEIRKNDLPFGGIQVIACGDFFQLPPVSKDNRDSSFCFESRAWNRTMKQSFTLRKVFRQKGDLEFIDMLNEMRMGIVTPKSLEKFRALQRQLPQDEVEPAELFSTRAEVEQANSYRLRNLSGASHYFFALDDGSVTDIEQRERLLSNFMAPETLELKKGAQVMMIKNIDETLVNGSLGKVIDFVDRNTYMSYEKLKNSTSRKDFKTHIEDTLALGSGVRDPIRDEIVGEEDEYLEDTIFEFLSDCESDDLDQNESIKSKIRLINEIHKSSRGQKLPLVRFNTPSGATRTVIVNPETWSVEDEKQQPLVKRTQLPLLLAWSLSIHKSQGQTLSRVSVNLARVFEKGQAYVAISRAVSRDGLQILNFDESKVFAHPKVIDFYKTLTGSEATPTASQSNTINMSEERLEYERRAGRQPEHHLPYEERPKKRIHDEVDQLHHNSQFFDNFAVPADHNEWEDPSYEDGSSEVIKFKRRPNSKHRVPEFYEFESPASPEVVSVEYSQ